MTITETVERGMNLLDDIAPGWEDKINIETLQIANVYRCVLGQLARKDPVLRSEVLAWAESQGMSRPWRLSYEHIVFWYEATHGYWDPIEYGFCPGVFWSWQLNDAWVKAIKKRRLAKVPKRTDFVLAS